MYTCRVIHLFSTVIQTVISAVKVTRSCCNSPNSTILGHSLSAIYDTVAQSQWKNDNFIIFFLYIFMGFYVYGVPLPPIRGQHTVLCHPRWLPTSGLTEFACWGGAGFKPRTTDLQSGALPLSHLYSDNTIILLSHSDQIVLSGCHLVIVCVLGVKRYVQWQQQHGRVGSPRYSMPQHIWAARFGCSHHMWHFAVACY